MYIYYRKKFQDQPRFTARQSVLDALSGQGLYRGAREYNTVLPICSRTGDVIEPRLVPQWYLDCTDMAQQAIKVRVLANPFI